MISVAATANMGAYDWAALPCDIIASIFECLKDYDVDRRRAAAVCTSWRRGGALMGPKKPTSVNVPFVCTCAPFNFNPCHCEDLKYFSYLRLCSYYFIISPASNRGIWLIRAEEVERNKWLLHHPCSWKDDYYQVPSSGSQYSFNLLDEYKILDVAKLYTLHHVFDISNDPVKWTMPYVRKVVPLPDLGMVLLLFDTKGKLAVWAEYAHQWSFLDTGKYEFDDVVYHEGQVYAIDTAGRLVTINPTRHILSEVASHPPGVECDLKVMNLVCSEGCLYLAFKGFTNVKPRWLSYIRVINRESQVENRPLLLRLSGETSEPKELGVFVFIFNKHERTWERVQSLADKVFFIANYATFSVCARDLKWNEGSFIYYMCKDFDNGPGFVESIEVYKLEGSVSTRQEDLPFDMNVQFWPPPPSIIN